MIDNIQTIAIGQIVFTVQELFDDGFRFVTMDCVQLEGKWQLIYHFDKDLNLKHYRVEFEHGEIIPSISKIYFCAMLIENEIQDLFGIKFSDLVVDFNGKLLITEEIGPTPQVISNLLVQITQKEKKGEPQDGK